LEDIQIKAVIRNKYGGVGTFMIQVAKYYEAHVTAVVSTRNVDVAKASISLNSTLNLNKLFDVFTFLNTS